MGAAGQARALDLYDEGRVVARTLDLLGLALSRAATAQGLPNVRHRPDPHRPDLGFRQDRPDRLGCALAGRGVELLSTGGSAKAMREAGLAVTDVSDHTGFPEILDGRVKTLVPQIHGGILARRDLPEHQAQMAAHGIAPIDLVVSNLYPFEATLASGAGFSDCIENIDIGGPALTRAAAKNHAFVAIVTEPAQYAELLAELAAQGGTTLRAAAAAGGGGLCAHRGL